jgi:hypothetical protein
MYMKALNENANSSLLISLHPRIGWGHNSEKPYLHDCVYIE